MSVPTVKKGQPLTADTWNKMAATVNNITSGTTGVDVGGRAIPCTIINRTNTTKKAGEILVVTKDVCYRIAQLTPDQARQAWINNGFQLDGGKTGTGTVATLIDGVKSGGMARCIVPGLCASYVTITTTTVPELVKFDPTYGQFRVPASNETGDWKIIAHSTKADSKVFAYLVPSMVASGGGGTIQAELTFEMEGGYTFTDDRLAADNDNIKIYREFPQSGGSKAVLRGATYTLNGPTSVVIGVACDENGDIVCTKQQISLTRNPPQPPTYS